MRKDTPGTNDILSENGVLGDEQKLLILHKAYVELTDNKEESEEEKYDKN